MHPVVLGRGFPVGPPAGGQQRPGPGIGRRRGAEPGAHFRTSPVARPPPKPLFRSGIDSALTPPPGLGYITSCVHRKRARVRPPSSVTSASHTWVVRPPWTSQARQLIRSPAAAVPMKFDLSSRVVNPVAPTGREATQPYPHDVSARAITVAAWRKPLGALCLRSTGRRLR